MSGLKEVTLYEVTQRKVVVNYGDCKHIVYNKIVFVSN